MVHSLSVRLSFSRFSISFFVFLLIAPSEKTVVNISKKKEQATVIKMNILEQSNRRKSTQQQIKWSEETKQMNWIKTPNSMKCRGKWTDPHNNVHCNTWLILLFSNLRSVIYLAICVSAIVIVAVVVVIINQYAWRISFVIVVRFFMLFQVFWFGVRHSNNIVH